MFDLFPDEARLLLNVALMATGRNRFRSAARLLAALEMFRPDDVAIANAKAIALISAQRFAETVDYIDREGLSRFPDSAMLKAFKGMALIRMERMGDAAIPLEEAARQVQDPAAAKLARDLLITKESWHDGSNGGGGDSQRAGGGCAAADGGGRAGSGGGGQVHGGDGASATD